MIQDNLKHPDSLTDEWAAFIKKVERGLKEEAKNNGKNPKNISFDYTYHDLRHTWITRAVRLKGKDLSHMRDVQLAAGHENIETTMRYLKDDREFSEEIYSPDEEEVA